MWLGRELGSVGGQQERGALIAARASAKGTVLIIVNDS